MPKVVVVSGANGLELGVSVAKAINGEFIMIEQKIFPDGELYIRLSDPTKMRDSIAIIVNTLFPEQNKSWIETLLLIDSVKEAGAEHVIGVIPYIAYSRQDKVFLPGEPVSIRALLKALKVSGMDYLLTVDIHNPVSLKEFGDHAKNVMISDLLAKEALKYTKTPLVLAPDKGALERARVAAEAIGAEFDYLIKYRDKTTGEVKLEPKEISVKNKDVIIIDDIISTGGTIALAAKESLRSGARSVIVAVSHALLIGNALEKIRNAGVQCLIASNSVKVSKDGFINIVDISRRLADETMEIIKRL